MNNNIVDKIIFNKIILKFILRYNLFMKFFLKENLNQIKKNQIRYKYVLNEDVYYFSIVDILGLVTESKDARNYWKVLKSRLKQKNNELVTKCNQLKLLSKDGKSYKTDTLESKEILKIIKNISPVLLEKFEKFFLGIEGILRENQNSLPYLEINNLLKKDFINFKVDVYENENFIFIKFIAPCVLFEDIEININENNEITIFIKRDENKILEEFKEKEYFIKELNFNNFYKKIILNKNIKKDKYSIRENKNIFTLKFEKEK